MSDKRLSLAVRLRGWRTALRAKGGQLKWDAFFVTAFLSIILIIVLVAYLGG